MNTPPSQRFEALDGLRGVAIVSVLLHHGCLLAGTEANRPWNSLIGFGSMGGEMFLALSGYFMTTSLFAVRTRARGVKSIYARRYLRLAPLYYLSLAIFVLGFPAVGYFYMGKPLAEALPTADRLVCYALGAANLAAARHDFTNPFEVTWTLSVQEQFFLLWIPLVVALPRRALPWLCGAVILTAVVLRPVAVAAGVSLTAVHVLTPFRMDALAIGAIVALARRDATQRPHRHWVPAAGVATVAFAGLLLAFPFQTAPWFGAVGYTLMGGLSALWLLAALAAAPGTALYRILTVNALTWYGQRSYAIYLFHLPVYYVLILASWIAMGWEYRPGMMKQNEWTFVCGLLTIPACVPVAWLCWRFVERPLERFRKRPDAPAALAPETKRITTEDRHTTIGPAVVAPQPARVYDDEDALTPPMGMAALA